MFIRKIKTKIRERKLAEEIVEYWRNMDYEKESKIAETFGIPVEKVHQILMHNITDEDIAKIHELVDEMEEEEL